MSAGRGSPAPGKPGMDLRAAVARPGPVPFDRRVIGAGGVVFAGLIRHPWAQLWPWLYATFGTGATCPRHDAISQAREDERSWLTMSQGSHIPRDGQ